MMQAVHSQSPMLLEYFIYILCIAFLSCAIAYLIGSIPFGLLLGKAFGAGDIRTIGSGNIGATNMLRTGRKGLAAATLLLDSLKGYVAVWLCSKDMFGMHAHRLFQNPAMLGPHVERISHAQLHYETITTTPVMIYMCGIAAVLGHIYPLWLNYKGGKGVATTLGVYFAFQPIVGVITIALWLITFILSRYSSFAAIVSIALSPIFGYFLCHDVQFTVMAVVIACIVITKHKENIARLRAGTESGWRKKI